MTISGMMKYIQDSFEKNSELIRSIYGNFEKYSQRIMDYVMYEKGRVPIGNIVEEVEKKTYELSNIKIKTSLDELLTDVIEMMRQELSDDFVRPEIYWTDRDYASYFAKYDIARNQIFVNNVLNSISVDEDVIKYLIYHECLHQEIHDHSKAFRDKEHKYPDFQKWDNFLDYKFRDYTKDFN